MKNISGYFWERWKIQDFKDVKILKRRRVLKKRILYVYYFSFCLINNYLLSFRTYYALKNGLFL